MINILSYILKVLIALSALAVGLIEKLDRPERWKKYLWIILITIFIFLTLDVIFSALEDKKTQQKTEQITSLQIQLNKEAEKTRQKTEQWQRKIALSQKQNEELQKEIMSLQIQLNKKINFPIYISHESNTDEIVFSTEEDYEDEIGSVCVSTGHDSVEKKMKTYKNNNNDGKKLWRIGAETLRDKSKRETEIKITVRNKQGEFIISADHIIKKNVKNAFFESLNAIKGKQIPGSEPNWDFWTGVLNKIESTSEANYLRDCLLKRQSIIMLTPFYDNSGTERLQLMRFNFSKDYDQPNSGEDTK